MPHVTFRWFALVAPLALCSVLLDIAQAYPNRRTVLKDATFLLQVYGVYSDSVAVSGRAGLEWSYPYYSSGRFVVDAALTAQCLTGDSSAYLGRVTILLDSTRVSSGRLTSLGPSTMYPASGYVDVRLRCAIPRIFGTDTLMMSALRLEGEVDGMPPYFDQFVSGSGAVATLYRWGTPVGEIRGWREDALPYSPPAVFMARPMPRVANHLSYVTNDTLRVTLAYAGDVQPTSAAFGYRASGSTGPFQNFWLDQDGAGPHASTVAPAGSGDGWSGYLDISSFPVAGGFYDLEGRIGLRGGGMLADTVTFFIDPTPALPRILSLPKDSVRVLSAGSVLDVKFAVPDENPDSSRMSVRCGKGLRRELTPVNQHYLMAVEDGRSIVGHACVPSAAASCLKYFADHGYGTLDDSAGTGPPEVVAKRMARDLAKKMGTSGKDGTSTDSTTAGIRSFLKGHGQDKWDVEFKEWGEHGLAGLFEDFVADSEDVLLWLADEDSSGKTCYHVVTADSMQVSVVGSTVGFMDPNGGYEHRHELGGGGLSGPPTTEGYSSAGGPAPARIHGWHKVSPPGDSAGARLAGSANAALEARASPRRLGRTQTAGDWTVVASGPTTGGGQPDSLAWDTAGFPDGIYLLKVETASAAGPRGYDLRFCALVTSPTGVGDLEGPPAVAFLGVAPNPFTSPTTIRFRVARRGPVSLKIHDINGRLVRTLVDAEVGPGEHRAIWDGADSEHARVASGLYFLRIAAGQTRRTGRVIFLR